MSFLPLSPLLAAVAAVSLCTAPAAFAAERETAKAGSRAAAGAERLAALLEGREAGEPVRCIATLPTDQITTIDHTAYVFGRGATIYVQHTSDPASIRSDRALAVQRYQQSELCRLDPARTFDPIIGFFTGNVFFENFIPYSRMK